MSTSYDDSYDPEFQLLGRDPLDSAPSDATHALRTAPIVTADALHVLGPSIFPQRALYGRILAQRATGFANRPISPKVYINTNAPFSALVCGVQGSGKSHSTSVLLESCLMSDPRLGTLPAPLSAILFHFDTAAGGGLVQPCEAAYLASLDAERGLDATPPAVTVLVLPTNLQAMKRVYAGLPSVKVEPLHFSPEDISGERLLAMMKVDENTQMPLYMEAIMSILRSMESSFDYTQFRDRLKMEKFNPSQKAMLNLRLSLLDSCLQGGTLNNRATSHFKKGQLTIIDLSSPFMDGSSACGFFDLILGLFVEADVDTNGKLIVLDEAHKYLSESQTGTSARLTDSLLTVIRQQRHLATRVVISTQEPTVVPCKYLDLCSFIIAHRFSSPKWLKLLAEHVSAAGDSFDDLFSKIVSLGTGQAILFAPNGVGVRSSSRPLAHASDDSSSTSREEEEEEHTPTAIGQGYLHVQSRLRVTRDGGHSILAVPDDAGTRLGRVAARPEPPASGPWPIPPASVASEPNPSDAPTSHRDTTISEPLRAPAPTSTSSTALPLATNTSAPPIVDPEFKPLVDYLEWKRSAFQAPTLSVKNIRRHFVNNTLNIYGDRVEEIVQRAEQKGLISISMMDNKPWVTLLVQGTVPTASVPTSAPPPPVLAATAPAKKAGSTPSSSILRVITCPKDKTHLIPLMRHIVHSPSPQGMKIGKIQTHFNNNSPGIYGKKLKNFIDLASEAIRAGLLVSTTGQVGTKSLARVGLVPDARYSI